MQREVMIVPWQAKPASMCIAVSGSSCTGKTSLIEAVNEYSMLPLVPEGFREYVKEKKLKEDHMNWAPKTRMKVQMDILQRRKAIENSKTQFLADRTVIDAACITMAHLSHLPEYQRGVMDYVNECLIHAQQTYDCIFMLPHGTIPTNSRDNYMPAWQAQLQLMTEHLTALGQPTFYVHQIQALHMSDRVAEMLEVLDQISQTKAEVKAKQEGNKVSEAPNVTQ